MMVAFFALRIPSGLIVRQYNMYRVVSKYKLNQRTVPVISSESA